MTTLTEEKKLEIIKKYLNGFEPHSKKYDDTLTWIYARMAVVCSEIESEVADTSN